MVALFSWFVKITGWILSLTVFRTKVYYEDADVQRRRIKGKAIITPNHTSVFDFAGMMFLFPLRTLRCVVAEVMFNKNFFMNVFLRMLGSIRVERDDFDFSFLGKCKRILDRGGVVEIYPESRLPKPGESRPLEFKPSAVYLALEADAPIIPIYTDGKYFCKQRCRIIIGKPIYVRELYDSALSEKENIENINAYLRGKIIELSEQLAEKQKEEKVSA